MALAVVSPNPTPAPSIRVALVRTTASCAAAYNEFRRALVARGLEVSEAGIGSIGAEHRRRVVASEGVGWVFVVCRMAANDMVTTRLIQEELSDAGLSRGDCVVLTPLETRGAAQAASVVRKVEMNLRLLEPRGGVPQPPRLASRNCVDSDVRTQVLPTVRLVQDDEGESRSETEMTMPYEVVPDGSTRVYEPVRERGAGARPHVVHDPPSRRLSAPESIGESVVARRSYRGLKAFAALAVAGCFAGVVAWQWDGEGFGLGAPAEQQVVLAEDDGSREGEVRVSPGPKGADEPERATLPPDGAAPAEPTGSLDTAVAEEAASDVQLVAAALEARSIRALDSVLVDRQRSKRVGFDKAHARCEDREVDGVTGWRLPEIGELRSLSKKRMLPKGRYWTANAANLAGSHQVVWDAVHKHIAVAPRDSKRVRSVCVRDQPGHVFDS